MYQIHVSNQISLRGTSILISRMACNGYTNRSNFYSRVITYTCKTVPCDMSTCTTIFGSGHLLGYAWHFLGMMHCIVHFAPSWQEHLTFHLYYLYWLTSLFGIVRFHSTDVIMSLMASQITSLTIVYSPVYSGTDQRKHQSSASLVFVRGIHRESVNSPHKRPVTRKMFPFDDVIMCYQYNRHMLYKATFQFVQIGSIIFLYTIDIKLLNLGYS